jgi:hypothetical protein
MATTDPNPDAIARMLFVLTVAGTAAFVAAAWLLVA